MKKILSLGIVITALISSGFAKDNHKEKYSDSLEITLTNVLDISRIDEPISVNMLSIVKKFPHFSPGSFILFDGDNEIASQVDDTDRDGMPDILSFVANFAPRETEKIVVRYRPTGLMKKEYKKRTQAELSAKVDYEYLDGKFTKGRFVNIDSIRVPANHVDHDALFRYEGPGWESDKIAYRFYLDARNRTDIFGKVAPDMVMQTIGVHDLVADNNESYQSRMNWGMDIFKVGNSLGIGSIAMQQGNDVVTVSKTDSIFCTIAANGPIRSDVRSMHYGWEVGGKKYTLVSDYSITAGSRLTKYEATIFPNPENLCTGLAKHDQTTLLESPIDAKRNWKFLALYGKQSRAGDDLGIALFYKGTDLIERRDDAVNQLVVLRPHDGKLTYYFAAAWQEEPNGVATIDEFHSYLDSVVLRLDNPILVSF
jgi:hypothetical protein